MTNTHAHITLNTLKTIRSNRKIELCNRFKNLFNVLVSHTKFKRGHIKEFTIWVQQKYPHQPKLNADTISRMMSGKPDRLTVGNAALEYIIKLFEEYLEEVYRLPI